MHKFLINVAIVFVLSFVNNNVVAQSAQKIIYDSNNGLSSFLVNEVNVNAKEDVHIEITFLNTIPSELYIVGNSKLSDLRISSPQIKLQDVSDLFSIFNNDERKIFRLSEINIPTLNLKLVIASGNWKSPITFLDKENFDRLSFNKNKSQYRRAFFIHLTNSFVLIMFLFGVMSFVMYCISKFKVYLYYSLHCLMISIYYLNKVNYLSDVLYGVIGINGVHILNNAIQPIMYYFLALFMYEFLDAKHKDKLFAKMLIYFAKFALVSSILIFIIFFISKDLSEHVYNLYRVITIIFSSYIAGYLIYKKYSVSTQIIGYSNAVLILLGTMAMYTSIANIIVYGIAPLDFFTLGMLFFIIGISSAMAFKAYDGEIERIKAKESIIELEREAKQKLESDLQIVKLNEKNNQIEKDIAELELLVLRNQLNPHFLYNSMNTLKLYILNNENLDAAKFIDRFSGLFRKVLNNSRQRLITLHDELEAMQQYLDLEQIRFRNSFTYLIKVDDNIDTTFTRIPPMIFQPFLENAINHGIGLNENRSGHILLEVMQLDEDYYKVTIVDNGVGRVYAQNIKSKKITAHQSLGTQIIEDRLTAINKLYNYFSYFEYLDLYDQNGNAMGTSVDLILPIEL